MGFRVHDVVITGPINLTTRIPLYHETLRLAVAPHFFCIVDNSAGFENNITYDDIQLLDGILWEHGIRTFYGATITKDAGYSKIVKLAQANMEHVGLDGALIEVRRRTAAENFIRDRIAEEAARRGNDRPI